MIKKITDCLNNSTDDNLRFFGYSKNLILVSLDWPMLYTGNPYVITPGNVFFMHMILMDSDSNLAMNLGETYLVTENGNERLGKQKLDLVVL